MISLLILETISVISLIFAVLNIIFNFTSGANIFGFFVYTSILGSGIAYLKKKNKIYLLGLLLLSPALFFFKGVRPVFFLLSLMVSIYIYFTRALDLGSYSYFSERFKKSFFIIGTLIFLAILISEFREFLMPGLIFLVIYLISGLVLVRSIRHLESGMDIDKLKATNRRYLFVIFIVSIMIAIDPIRNAIAQGFSLVLGLAVDGILAILYIPIMLFAGLIDKIINLIRVREFQDLEMGANEINYGEMGEGQAKWLESEVLIKLLMNIMGLILILLGLYIIFKILSKLTNRDYEGLEYEEEREYIRTRPRKKRFLRERYPKDLRGQIRYYYRRYLKDLGKKEIDLRSSDTSLDIKAKSEDEFKQSEKIREVYIRARYKDGELKEEDLQRIKEAYKDK